MGRLCSWLTLTLMKSWRFADPEYTQAALNGDSPFPSLSTIPFLPSFSFLEVGEIIHLQFLLIRPVLPFLLVRDLTPLPPHFADRGSPLHTPPPLSLFQ